ncbi:MAG: rhomboid family intramembrane serine protease [Bacteroidota bacterium]
MLTIWDTLREPFQFIWPRKGYFITPIVMLLNIGIWGLMVATGIDPLSPSTPDLIEWGALYSPAVEAGEFWRLETATFLHVGVLHLGMNMLFLMFLGRDLEQRTGSARFFVMYFVAGLGGSVASLFWYWTAEVPSAGASGAIFGLFGVTIGLLATNVISREKNGSLLLALVGFVGYNLLVGSEGLVDNAAHIGGLLTGFLVALLLTGGMKKEVGEMQAATEIAAGEIEGKVEEGKETVAENTLETEASEASQENEEAETPPNPEANQQYLYPHQRGEPLDTGEDPFVQ